MSAKMNPEVKADWIEALVSGDYEQTTDGMLCEVDSRGNKFCCLGVLCDLHAKKYGDEWGEVELPNRKRRLDYMGEWCGLPEQVMEWAGLEGFKEIRVCGVKQSLSHVELTDDVDEYRFLTSINDGGASFESIAEIIKERL